MTEKFIFPIKKNKIQKSISIKKSPNLFITKTLKAALKLRAHSLQKCTKKREVILIPSQPK
jgi:hypothetical protein